MRGLNNLDGSAFQGLVSVPVFFKKIVDAFNQRIGNPQTGEESLHGQADGELDARFQGVPPPPPPPGAPAKSPLMPVNELGSGIPGLTNLRPGEISRTKGLVVSDESHQAYRERDEHVRRVHELFGVFGSVISSYVLTQSLSSGGVGRILSKLQVTSRGRDGADLAQIEGWILKNGADSFCKVVGIREHASAGSIKTPVKGRAHAVDKVIKNENAEESGELRVDQDPKLKEMIRRSAAKSAVESQPRRKVSVRPIDLSSGEQAPEPTPDKENPRSAGFPFLPGKKRAT